MDTIKSGRNCFNCEHLIMVEASYTDLNFGSSHVKTQAYLIGVETHDNKKYYKSAVKVKCPNCHFHNVFVFLRAENELYFTEIETKGLRVFND